jgi:hypothetical protein
MHAARRVGGGPCGTERTPRIWGVSFIAFMSDNHVGPDFAVEVFVLAPREAGDESDPPSQADPATSGDEVDSGADVHVCTSATGDRLVAMIRWRLLLTYVRPPRRCPARFSAWWWDVISVAVSSPCVCGVHVADLVRRPAQPG